MQHLAQTLLELGYLSEVHLHFSNCDKIKNKGVHDLFLAIANMKALSAFDLGCVLNKSTYNAATVQLLERLLNFPGSHATHIKGKKNLSPDAPSSLCLTFFSKYSITNQEIPSLSAYLRNIKSLSTLILGFTLSNQIDDIKLQLLSCNLKTIVALSTLRLDLTNCSLISDSSCLSLSSGLVELKMLTSLSLSFCNCDKLIDEALNSLGSCLKFLNLAELLKLEFSSCKLFAIKGIEILADGFEHMSHLAHLIIYIRVYALVNDEYMRTRVSHES